jgi:hypothetical protein
MRNYAIELPRVRFVFKRNRIIRLTGARGERKTQFAADNQLMKYCYITSGGEVATQLEKCRY